MINKRLSFHAFIFMIFMIGIWTSQGFTLEKKTHEAINEEIAQRSFDRFPFDTYLINQLGFPKGINEELNGVDSDEKNIKKKVFWWLGYGGEQEDVPPENEKSWKGLKILYNNQVRADEIEPAVMI